MMRAASRIVEQNANNEKHLCSAASLSTFRTNLRWSAISNENNTMMAKETRRAIPLSLTHAMTIHKHSSMLSATSDLRKILRYESAVEESASMLPRQITSARSNLTARILEFDSIHTEGGCVCEANRAITIIDTRDNIHVASHILY